MAAVAQDACGDQNVLASLQPIEQSGTRGDPARVTDGVMAPEATRWDSPEALLLDSAQSEVTYDLGAPRKLGIVTMQADANDTYRVSGSLDGVHFDPLAEIPNVVRFGHGLRERSASFAVRSLRYLRIGEANGDGFYSIAELAAYCQAPAPRAHPTARSAATRAAGSGDSAPGVSFALSGTLLTLIGLLFVGLTISLFASKPRSSSTPGADTRTERRLHAMFLLSGCAALIYEIVWFHLLRLVIGASALSVGLVLASFMGGMFLGSLLFARLVPATRNPLRVYAWLELGIGVFGIGMPFVLPLVRSLYIGLFGYGAASIALRAVIAAALLLPPTALMGATLPAISRRYGHGPSAGASLASLYAVNTLGAVLGCLLTGFWLLAKFDVWIATLTAAAINACVGVLALSTAKSSASLATQPPPTAAQRAPASSRLRRVYVAAGLSGCTALAAQVVWTRLLTLLFGATVYAFAIILAVFLAGLGSGGALATFWLRRGGHAVRGLLFSQAGLVATLCWSGYLLADVLPYSAPSTLTPNIALHWLDMLRALDVILPAACLWGMSFPFALAAVSGEERDAARASGQLYAANTLGAIAGSLATSFWSIPAFGTHLTEQALVIVATLSPTLLIFQAEPAQAASSTRNVLRALTVVCCGALAASLVPGVATKFLAHGRHIWSIDPADTYPYVSEGATATVAVHIAPDGYKNFHVSGRVEASNNPDDLRLERLLGHLSALAIPNPHSVLVVGLGGGVTAGALSLHPEVKRIVICEIEPRVTGATREFARENYSILNDPRVELVFDDARHYLATTRERFDVITSDPIHPWVRGNSVLFSKQYYAIVREHLREGGIATQWVPLYDTNDEAIRIQMHTFSAAFADASVWNSSIRGGGYDVVLLGRAKRIPFSLAAIQARIDANPRLNASLREVHIDSAIDLLATYGASSSDMTQYTRDAPINDDFSLKLEYISGLALNQQRADSIYRNLTAKSRPPTALFIGAGASELLQRIAEPTRKLR